MAVSLLPISASFTTLRSSVVNSSVVAVPTTLRVPVTSVFFNVVFPETSKVLVAFNGLSTVTAAADFVVIVSAFRELAY